MRAIACREERMSERYAGAAVVEMLVAATKSPKGRDS
jgi:hypothetical protein